MKYAIIISVLVTSLFLVGCADTTKYDAFAQCVTDSGAKMFGAFWCGHCEQQKKELGDSFEKINYIECSLPDRSAQTEVCELAGIEGYPTWEFTQETSVPEELTGRQVEGPNGENRVSGKLDLEDLAQITGCQLP